MFTYRGTAALAESSHCRVEVSYAKISGAETYMHCAYPGQHLLGGTGAASTQAFLCIWQMCRCSKSVEARWGFSATSFPEISGPSNYHECLTVCFCRAGTAFCL